MNTVASLEINGIISKNIEQYFSRFLELCLLFCNFVMTSESMRMTHTHNFGKIHITICD